MMGYATSRPDLAAGDVQNGRLMTGDIGHLDEEGFLYVTGRRKRDAKVFGLRLNMDEIEDMMRVHGPTAVVSCGEKLLLFCEYGDADQFQGYARELSAKLKVHAGAFQFHRIEQLPLTANGKLDYARLEGRQ
jgi:acyl-CoA synthetase (AMP-forming)/AMP-acid ligase II